MKPIIFSMTLFLSLNIFSYENVICANSKASEAHNEAMHIADTLSNAVAVDGWSFTQLPHIVDLIVQLETILPEVECFSIKLREIMKEVEVKSYGFGLNEKSKSFKKARLTLSFLTNDYMLQQIRFGASLAKQGYYK